MIAGESLQIFWRGEPQAAANGYRAVEFPGLGTVSLRCEPGEPRQIKVESAGGAKITTREASEDSSLTEGAGLVIADLPNNGMVVVEMSSGQRILIASRWRRQYGENHRLRDRKASCIGLAGGVEGCEVTSATPKTLPWSVTVTTSTLTAKATGVTYAFDTGCSIHKIETSFPELTLTSEEPSAIKLFHFGQSGTGLVEGESATVTTGGTLQMSAAQEGVYGIG